jgi:heme exporter protein B
MKAISSIFFKDIVIEWRNKESISSMFMFGLLSLVIFNYAFDPSGAERGLLTPGILWVSYMFAGIIGLNRSLAMETDNDCLQGLLLAPLSRGELYLGKVASNFAFMMIAELLMIPPFVVLNNLTFNLQILEVIGVAVLGTLGFVSVGTILSMISSQTRMKEVLLAVLQIPITLPVILSAVGATARILQNDTEGIGYALLMLGGFTIVYLTASYLLFDYVVED